MECADCGEFLMGSNEKPHMTAEELQKAWTGMVLSAPLNAPKCQPLTGAGHIF